LVLTGQKKRTANAMRAVMMELALRPLLLSVRAAGALVVPEPPK
jgi:hypothetical protein